MNAFAIPAFGTVLRQQLRLLWLSGRPKALAAIMIGGLLLMRAIVWWVDAQFGADVDVLFAQVPVLMLIIGGGWALGVWRDDPPRLRRYHWSMPVDVTQHDLARVLAGAVWLSAATVVYFVAGSLLAVVDGGAAELRGIAGAAAIYYALAPLVAYLLMSGFGVASNRPSEWALGLIFGFQAVAALTMILPAHHLLTRMLETILGGSWGLGIALSGEAAMGQQGSTTATFGDWLPVVLLWLVIASALLPIVALGRRGRA